MTVSPPSHPNPEAEAPRAAALLVLDASGQVELASPAAGALWQTSAGNLTGKFLPTLFVSEVATDTPGWVQDQWEAMQAAALTQPIALELQPVDAAPVDCVVLLEKTEETPVRFFAYISRPPASAATRKNAETDNFLSVLNDRSALGFFDLNFVTQFTYLSPAWKRMLGYTEASLPSTYASWVSLIHPDDTAAAPDKLSGRAPSTGTRPFAVEYRMKHARGHFVWVQSVGVQLFAPNGSLQRVVGAHLDVTERKELEESAIRAEDRLAVLTERGRVALFELDFVGEQTWLSPAFKHLLGYGEKELPNTLESFLRGLPPDETTGGLSAFFSAKHPGQSVFFDTFRLRHRNGTDLWGYTGVIRVLSRKRELLRVLGFVTPMPEGASAGGRSGLTAEQFSILLTELHEGVLIVDPRGRVVFLNTVAERLLGCAAERTIGEPAADVFRLVHRESGVPGESPFDRALISGESTPLNNEFLLDQPADQKPVPLLFSCRAVLDTSGQATGGVLVFRNPDEMTLTPDELVRANRFDALGQLAGGISHDFNNLLTTILGGISLAKDNRDYTGLENSERACLAAKALSKQ
ncbi:MAG: PAS domain-containing protein, partial [Candidatus Didemnitutus sp.]|nr:PAS domain-containing protein [Candidatus Didemnitutus sp.]